MTETKHNYEVCFKEKLYFSIMMLFGLPIAVLFFPIFLVVLVIGGFFSRIASCLAKGKLVGNSIKITKKQFPQYYNVLEKQSNLLNLNGVPEAYIVQSGGILNALATRFCGRNYVILYSGLLSRASEEGQDAVEFIIGHELGHIKRNHLSFVLNILILPSLLIPFLFNAYSRAREYTCDSIGKSLAPLGAEKGLLILSAGKELAGDVNIDELIYNYHKEKGFSTWLAEIFSTHPLTIKRIIALRKG